jgi:hypothetical protein
MGFGYVTARETFSVVIGDPAADNKRIHLFKVPSDLRGEILSANLVCQNAQNAGSAGTFQLENWGTAGTAVGGTIAVGLGGTAVAARLSAETPAAYTISEGTLVESEWVVLDYQEVGDFVEGNVTLHIEIQWGIGANA